MLPDFNKVKLNLLLFFLFFLEKLDVKAGFQLFSPQCLFHHKLLRQQTVFIIIFFYWFFEMVQSCPTELLLTLHKLCIVLTIN